MEGSGCEKCGCTFLDQPRLEMCKNERKPSSVPSSDIKELVTVPHPKRILNRKPRANLAAGGNQTLISGVVMFYPAYIHSDSDGSASGFFPDVPGCFFAGDSLDDAFQDAREALTAHFEALFEVEELPIPGNVEAHLESSWRLHRRAVAAGGY
jgi:predicted RNase H-like HicB family nuclease